METEEEARPMHMQFMENQYVKVYGIIKSLQGQKIVQAFRILPIKELNQITHHMLECMNASIHFSSKANGEGLDVHMGDNNPLKNSNLSGMNSGKNTGGLDTLHSQVILVFFFFSNSIKSNLIIQSKFK
jgi:hypothetical protein